MRGWLGTFLILASAGAAGAGCGNVNEGPPDAGCLCDAPTFDAAPRGEFVWQQALPNVAFVKLVLHEDEPHLGGMFVDTIDLGGGALTSTGSTDLFVARFDAGGTHRWSWSHGGPDTEFVTGMSVDPFGNPALVGMYMGTGNVGGADLPNAMFLLGYGASYMPNGTQRWQLPISAQPRSISADGNGGAALTGEFSGTLTLGGPPSHTSAGMSDGFYAHLTSAGVVQTVTTFGAASPDSGYDVVSDPLGTVVMLGTFVGSIDVGATTLTSGPGRDLVLGRMMPNGAPIWAVNAGSDLDVHAFPRVAVTPTGDVVVAVGYQGTLQVTGGSPVTSAGGFDVAVFLVSPDGQVMWTKSFGGAGDDIPYGLDATASGIAVTGEFAGSASFGGAELTSAGFSDAFLARYDTLGNHLWSRGFGGGANDAGYDAAIDSTGAVYLAAAFRDTASFGGPELTAGSMGSRVLVRYTP